MNLPEDLRIPEVEVCKGRSCVYEKSHVLSHAEGSDMGVSRQRWTSGLLLNPTSPSAI